MKFRFTTERGGRDWFLVKHPRDRKLPLEEQAKRPWYIRMAVAGEKNNRWKKVGEAHETEAAVIAARDLMRVARVGGNPFTELLEATRYRSTLTAGTIIEAWCGAGCPEPNGSRRTESQQTRQKAALKTAKLWWSNQSVASITGPTLHQYAVWRRGQAREGDTGDRAIDIDLTVLSNCFAWAQAVGQTERNPFQKRPRFRRPEDIDHCNQYMPADDEELHRLCGLLISSVGTRSTASDESSPIPTDDLSNIVAGAQLLFQALTGLRPGEPGLLQWNARFVDGRPAPGHRYPVTLEGQKKELLAVQRLKGGINPAVEVHPALREFLNAWEPFARATWPATPWYFPDPLDPSKPFTDPEDKRKRLGQRLNAAATALGLPERHPHSMRGYFVRVRRSQGYRDAVIAEDLGQGSGPKEIVRCYGDPRGIFGDGRYDWQPDSTIVKPAWTLLPAVEPITVPLHTTQHTEDQPLANNRKII